MKTCKYCGGELIDTAKKCKHCGEWLDINCPYCEGEVSPQAEQCPHCGEKLKPAFHNQNNQTNKGYSWTTTMLFAWFFGIFGGHRFYVGKTKTAIAMLLITLLTFWFGGTIITGIWLLCDLIYIYLNKFTDVNGNLLVKRPTQTSTALWCFFGGISGTHSFYTGKITIGFIQLFTLCGLGIWWLIDLITILTGSYKDANGDLLPHE